MRLSLLLLNMIFIVLCTIKSETKNKTALGNHMISYEPRLTELQNARNL